MPRGFLGANVDGPMLEAGVPLDREVERMVRSGVETARVAVYWNVSQRYPLLEAAPPSRAAKMSLEDGVPTDWRPTDRILGALARRGIRVFATVLRAPAWAARTPLSFASPPSNPRAYARFVAALARRYGPRGELWRRRPSRGFVPVRDWQVWNEPNNAGLTERYGYETTPSGQAERLGIALRRLSALRRELRLDQVNWYTWLTTDTGEQPFGYAGLRVWRRGRSLPKPAWRTFRRVARNYEGRTKATLATTCR